MSTHSIKSDSSTEGRLVALETTLLNVQENMAKILPVLSKVDERVRLTEIHVAAIRTDVQWIKTLKRPMTWTVGLGALAGIGYGLLKVLAIRG